MAREHRASLPAGRGVGKRASSRMPLTTSVLGFWKGMQPLWLQGLGQPRLESLTFQLGRALMLGRSRLKRVYSVFFPFAGECRLGLTPRSHTPPQCSRGTANLLGVLGVIRVPSDNVLSLKACVCCVIQTLIFKSILLLHIVCETWDYLDRG